MSPLKKIMKNSMKILRLKHLKKLLVDYYLASEGCRKFKYRIDKAPSWSDFDFEFVVLFQKS